jgi:hypothetical protein
MNARESVQAEAWTQAVTKCIRSRAPILQHSSSALRYCSSRFHRQDGEKHEERIRRPAVACQGVPPSLRRVSCGGDCGLVSGAQPWCGRRDRVDQIGRMDVERSIATGELSAQNIATLLNEQFHVGLGEASEYRSRGHCCRET